MNIAESIAIAAGIQLMRYRNPLMASDVCFVVVLAACSMISPFSFEVNVTSPVKLALSFSLVINPSGMFILYSPLGKFSVMLNLSFCASCFAIAKFL